MPTTPLAERIRDRLLALLSDDRADAERLLARLRELRSLDEIPAFSAALRLLAHLEMGEAEAETLFIAILRHRAAVASALKRDPGLRVAAVDYLSNVERRLTNPKIVELSSFERTERSAVTDPLTGLYNRRFFGAAMEREVRRSRRYGLGFSLLMLDLDHFKRVNDAHGHLFGDVVIQRAARILRHAVREADMGCRFGGEEFAVILPETDRVGAHVVADRIRVRVEREFEEKPVRGRPIPMTLSGGISSHPEDGLTTEILTSRADEALYLAKAAGRNRICPRHGERRASARFAASPRARVRVAGVAPGAAGRFAKAINLSQGGVLVETVDPPRPADAVRVELGGDGGRGSWEVAGRVVRVEPGLAPALACRVGIAFDRPLPEECLRSQAEGPPLARSQP